MIGIKTHAIGPIGRVTRGKYGVQLRIDEPFRPGLLHLGKFSHVIVLWWADRFDTEEYRSIMRLKPFYAKKVLTGVFATRSPHRPNPLAMTVCRILDLDESEGVVVVSDIDAYNGTEIVDLKGYYPVTDRVESPRIPDWLPVEFSESVGGEGKGPDRG